MLEFAFPWALLALPLPLLIWWFIPPYRRQVSALRVPFFETLVRTAGAEARAGAVVMRRRILQMAAAILVWALLVAGLAKPEWVGEPIVRTEAARDVMLAIDLSGSMDYRDYPGEDGNKVSRFEAVQRVVDRFVAERESDRIGLIVFGTKAYLQLPFTRDLQTARTLVQLMEVGMAGPQTALGDSIGLSIRSFESSEVDDRLLILLTDGNDTASKMTPINAADIAKLNGVEIHTVGIGDPSATGEDRVDFDLLQLNTFLQCFRLHELGYPIFNILPHAPEIFGEAERRAAEPFFSVLALLGGTHVLRSHEIRTVHRVRQVMDLYQP